MNRRWQKILTLSFTTVITLFLPGCWDYHRINDRAQVIGIAVDAVPKQPQLIQYTFQVPLFSDPESRGKVGGIRAGEGGKQPSATNASSDKFRNFTEVAPTLMQAITHAQMHYDRNFYFNNLESVILSEKLKTSTIEKVLAALMRSGNIDKMAFVAFSRDPAKDILAVEASSPPADVMERILGGDLKQIAYVARTRLWEYWRDFVSIGVDPHAPTVKVDPDGNLMFSGLYAVNRGKQSVNLTPEETMMFNLINNQIKNASLWVNYGGQPFELSFMRGSGRFFVTNVPSSHPVLHIRATVRAQLAQDPNWGLENVSQKELYQDEWRASQQMDEEIRATIEKLKNKDLDILGFGQQVSVLHPRLKSYIEHDWGRAYKQAQIDVKVRMLINYKGNLM
ncbi:Ger(x)C family spore germination protein [Alicyclobacillus tolerans]|uniref:Ger(x)C family spore germination protein n=1 Tax=Alicyclobacillus tolerans TaxID=90970 RepID=UPI003B801859